MPACLNYETGGPDGPCGSLGAIDDILIGSNCDADPPKIYRVETRTYTGCSNEGLFEGGPCPNTPGFSFGNSSGTLIRTTTYASGDCIPSIGDEGKIDTPSCQSTAGVCEHGACVEGSCDTGVAINADGACVSETVVYSDEYTTADLIDATLDSLPDYDDDFDDACTAYRNLSEGESSLTIQRVRYKFTLPEMIDYLRIWWIERFTPTDGDPIDTERTTTISGSDESAVFEMLEPDTNGSIDVVEIHASTEPG